MFAKANKEDLLQVADELDVVVPLGAKMTVIKNLIEQSEMFKTDKDFVQYIVETVVEERTVRVYRETFALELERIELAKREKQTELEKLREKFDADTSSYMGVKQDEDWQKLPDFALNESDGNVTAAISDKLPVEGILGPKRIKLLDARPLQPAPCSWEREERENKQMKNIEGVLRSSTEENAELRELSPVDENCRETVADNAQRASDVKEKEIEEDEFAEQISNVESKNEELSKKLKKHDNFLNFREDKNQMHSTQSISNGALEFDRSNNEMSAKLAEKSEIAHSGEDLVHEVKKHAFEETNENSREIKNSAWQLTDEQEEWQILYGTEAVAKLQNTVVECEKENLKLDAGLKIRSRYVGPCCVIAVRRKGLYDAQKVWNPGGPNTTCAAVDFVKPWDFDEL